MYPDKDDIEAFFSKILKWIVIVVLVVGVIALFGLGMEYLKVREVGEEFVPVFFVRVSARLVAGAALFLLTFVLTMVNGSVMRRVASSRGELMWIMKRKFIIAVSAIFGLLTAVLCSSGLGESFLLFANAAPYGETDPLFGKDISYFFFRREFYMSAVDIFVFIAIMILAYTAVSYIVMYAGDRDRESLLSLARDKKIFGHCAVIVFILGAVKALTYRFTAEGLVYSSVADVTGAGYTAVNIWRPFYAAAPYIISVLIILALIFLFRGKLKRVLVCVAAFPAALIVVTVVAAFTQHFIVAPEEVAHEQPYIESNMKYTKMGFGLDNVEIVTFPVSENLTAADIEANEETISNIRITDLQSTLSVSNSAKSIRSYYTFTDSDIVPYYVNGKQTALNIAPRELDQNRLPDAAQNYINRHLRYTHGYGIVANTINATNSDGQPLYTIDNMPVTSQAGYPEVTQPRIYYGEKSDSYAIVNTGYDELDYVTDEELTGKIYDADSGIKMTMFNRLLFAIDNLDYKMLISGYINSDSRLLITRNIYDRVEKAVPFLIQDNDPYILIDENGRLKWILDLYTASDKMPYGQKYAGVSYIRNSAKAVIDAYSGDLNIYITDEKDPIIKTYKNIYPGAFTEGDLPADLAEHIRCPEMLFKIQYQVYSRYHMTDTTIFYGNSDLWTTPKEKYMTSDATDMQPYYNFMEIQNFGSEDAELVLMQPFVPANRENLVGWLASRSNGEMLLYRFPTGETVYGPLHIENRIDSDATISREMSLWNQNGSRVIRGNLLVIPIEQSLLYVEPIYISTDNDAALPEVARVIVGYGDEVVMDMSLSAALDRLFGSGEAAAPEDNKPESNEGNPTYTNPSGSMSAVARAYEDAERAMRSGDWARFGESMEELKKAIYGQYVESGVELDEEN
ncbi:MAG: UPF0182 family protein [Oscillospiraceae bacterium]|nr:UPF0182 family protein [Oscillospiraceae bacterium]